MRQGQKIPELFTLSVEHRDSDLWVVTSPEVRGLLVAKSTMDEALGSVGHVLRCLEAAANGTEAPAEAITH